MSIVEIVASATPLTSAALDKVKSEPRVDYEGVYLISPVVSSSDVSNPSEASQHVQPSLDPQKLKIQSQRVAFDAIVRQAKAHVDDPIGDTEAKLRAKAKEEARIINRARDYQQELFERAKDENIIAVLDTGSGKTLIACLLIKHIIAQELIARDRGCTPRIVFFLANTVPLVLQQCKVLKNNLPQKAISITGNGKGEPWKDSELLATAFEYSRPIVCTPAILQQCLDSALIDISQIALIVFDEAHHAKKEHPYSRIVRSYYLKCPPEDRPKIFGMTASPVDSKGNIDENAKDLEALLDSKIVTTSDLSILSFAPKPQDVEWYYARSLMSIETDLYRELLSRCGSMQDTKKGFDFAKYAVTELGPWFADCAWKFVFSKVDDEHSSIVKKFEQSKAYQAIESIQEREKSLRNIEQAANIVANHVLEHPASHSSHFSPKVQLLYENLREQYTSKPSTRTMVFVDQRLTALVLHECFTHLQIPNLRPGVLLGIGSGQSSVKQQEKNLDQFRAGLINLIFATSVADEGIDIPQCNLCIRFDLYKTPIQYMQSRGRARMEGSVYVHMVREDDEVQRGMVRYVMASDKYIRDFCQGLPPDRLLGRGTKLDHLINRDAANRSFKTDAGAICDFGNSLLVLARFTSSLKHTGALEKEIYEEEIDLEKTQFRYTVRLPSCEEIQVKGARGDWRQNKQLAKRSAAFNCCFLLRSRGHLDDRLYSVFHKVKPSNLNARLAVTNKQASYSMQVKPELWKHNLGQVPDALYAAVIEFKPEERLRRQPHTLAMLTRLPLPNLPSFPLYLEDNIRTEIRITNISVCYTVSANEIEDLTSFTLDGIFRDVFNKTYQLDASNMSYWLAPLCKNYLPGGRDIANLINMDAIREVKHGRLQWSADTSTQNEWTNRFLCDPRNGKYHYFSRHVLPDRSIFDPVPENVPNVSQKSRANIIDFTDSSWKASKKRVVQLYYDPKQPVLSAEMLTTRRNFLDKATEKECEQITCLIAPQPLEVSRLSPEVAAAALAWPVVIYRVESYLITMEGFKSIGLTNIPADLALEAFTKDGDADEDGTQTHFAAGRAMGKNYERLEFIGDSLLKMMTTITVFNRTKCDEEGMHCRRMEILCNRRLYDVSTEKYQLYKYARTTAFDRATWYPENLILLHGRGAKKEPEAVKHGDIQQSLGMKTIADFSEAIIGAAVTISRDQSNPFDLGIQAITTLVDSEDHAITSWSEIAATYEAPDWSLQTNDVQANRLAKDVAQRTGYVFKHPRLLRSAFTHSSDTNATVPDLQRLEFLGDAVLDWACISWLYFTHSDKNPQWLTEHKMAMVSNKFLAALAVTLDFDKFILCSTTKLYSDITAYSSKVRELWSSESRGEKDNVEFWTTIDSPPKSLSDLVESYLGALLIDSDWDYSQIELFFTCHILPFFRDMSRYDTFANRHPTSYLYKKFTDEFRCRMFDLLSSDTTDSKLDDDDEEEINVGDVKIIAGVVVHGIVIAKSEGTSAKYARVRASKQALDRTEGLTPEEFRKKYRCDCQTAKRHDVQKVTLDGDERGDVRENGDNEAQE